MSVLTVLTSPWAITPAMLDQITSIYDAHLRGELPAELREQILAQFGKPAAVQVPFAAAGNSSADARKPYQVIDGVAIIPVQGVLAKKANLFMAICGGRSLQMMQDEFAQAMADNEARAVILHADTPGGTVDGTMQFAQDVFAARGQKPIATLADGMMASAGYWIGAAADQVYIADLTTNVGSIGVVTQHIDRSGRDKADGIKRTEIYAGKYKRIASDTGALSDEARAYVQQGVDHLYTVFVDAVASYRGQSVETVLDKMADGRVFIGQQAIDAGLVDGVKSLAELVSELSARTAPTFSTRASAARSPATPTKKGTTMSLTKEQVIADAPDVAEALRAEGRAEAQASATEQHQAALAAAKTDAAKAERDRILGIEAQAEGFAGHEALIASLKADGKTSPSEAASAILAAERSALTKQAKDLSADAPDPAAGSQSQEGGGNAKMSAKELAAAGQKLVADAEARGEKLSISQAITQLQKAS